MKVKATKAWARVTAGVGEIDVACKMTLCDAGMSWPLAKREGRIIPVLITPIVKRKKSKKGGK